MLALSFNGKLKIHTTLKLLTLQRHALRQDSMKGSGPSFGRC